MEEPIKIEIDRQSGAQPDGTISEITGASSPGLMLDAASVSVGKLTASWPLPVVSFESPCSTFVISDEAREIVRVNMDGTVIVAEGVALDDAARAFWDAVRRCVPAQNSGILPDAPC